MVGGRAALSVVQAGEGDVVEARDGDAAGHVDAVADQRVDHPKRGLVVRAGDRLGQGVPAGQQVWLVTFPRALANNNGGGNDCAFSWQLPAITSNSAYTTLWRVELASGLHGLSGGSG